MVVATAATTDEMLDRLATLVPWTPARDRDRRQDSEGNGYRIDTGFTVP
jgi:hypothetical protein